MTELVPTETLSSAKILDHLLFEAGSPRRRETLQRLKEACDALEGKNQSIRFAAIQQMVEAAHGKEAGPKAQSISNERKRPLGMFHYAEARERERLSGKDRAAGGKRTQRVTPISAMIDRIPDMDLRSHMRDLHDRCVLAEKSLERAKALFKSLHPGADPALLEHGHGAISASAPTTEQVEALDGLLSTLTDNARLTAVGLDYDGQRVRRKAGTRDELLGPRLLTLCGELLRSLRRRVSPAVD